MASLTQWTWVWVNSGRWWWTGRPGMLQSMGLQRVGHDWVTELDWTDTMQKRFLLISDLWESISSFFFHFVTKLKIFDAKNYKGKMWDFLSIVEGRYPWLFGHDIFKQNHKYKESVFMGFPSLFQPLPLFKPFGVPQAQHSPYSGNRAPLHQALSVNVNNPMVHQIVYYQTRVQNGIIFPSTSWQSLLSRFSCVQLCATP